MVAYPNYREIQPAIESPRPSLQTPSQTSLDHSYRTQPSAVQRRRRNATAACESCRKRKTKCSAERPRCTVCAAKGFECEYNVQPSESRMSALKRTHAEMECRYGFLKSIFSAMRSLPETEAHEILREIRSGAPVQKILHQIEADTPPGDIAPGAD
ncbi:hypothetical protein LX36DRAFT_745027 [Colletotrichum falcatum]|nr:hypothetical protein LX36DRAFT_745027 [Colletotrichum falcatum]